MSICRIVSIVDCGQQAPAAVHLRIVLVDLRDEQKDRRQEQRERKPQDQRIRGDVEDLESLEVIYVLKDLLGEVVELWHVWQNGLVDVGTLSESVYEW